MTICPNSVPNDTVKDWLSHWSIIQRTASDVLSCDQFLGLSMQMWRLGGVHRKYCARGLCPQWVHSSYDVCSVLELTFSGFLWNVTKLGLPCLYVDYCSISTSEALHIAFLLAFRTCSLNVAKLCLHRQLRSGFGVFCTYIWMGVMWNFYYCVSCQLRYIYCMMYIVKQTFIFLEKLNNYHAHYK